MVKGKTKSGIKFQMDERIKDDARFLYYLAKAQDSDADVSEQSKAVMGILKLVFGTDEGVINFMDAVASTNGGVCDIKTMLDELTEMFDALNAKNLSSSHK
jgi:hypothetical protein